MVVVLVVCVSARNAGRMNYEATSRSIFAEPAL